MDIRLKDAPELPPTFENKKTSTRLRRQKRLENNSDHAPRTHSARTAADFCHKELLPEPTQAALTPLAARICDLSIPLTGYIPYWVNQRARTRISPLFDLFFKIADRILAAVVDSDLDSSASLSRLKDALLLLNNSHSKMEIRNAVNAQDSDGNTVLHKIIKNKNEKLLKCLLLEVGDYLDFRLANNDGVDSVDLINRTQWHEAIWILQIYAYPFCVKKRYSRTRHWLNLALNFDSGRWVNHDAFARVFSDKAVLTVHEVKQTAITPGATFSKAQLKQIGGLITLYKISLSDGGDAITTLSDYGNFMRFCMLKRTAALKKSSAGNLDIHRMAAVTRLKTPECRTIDFARVRHCSFGEILEHYQVIPESREVSGRTIFYDTPLHTHRIAIKLAKTSEAVGDDQSHPLAQEYYFSTMLLDNSHVLRLKSEVPQPLELVRLTDIPEDICREVSTQANGGHHPFHIAENDLAFVYRAPHDYGTYIVDPALSPWQFNDGMHRAMHDFARIAQELGMFHSALGDFQHDAAAGRIHVTLYQEHLRTFRLGPGRLEKAYSGVKNPNIRASGLADLKHMIKLQDVDSRFSVVKLHTEPDRYYDKLEKILLYEATLLSDGLFAAAIMMMASQRTRSPDNRLNYESALRNIYSSFLEGYGFSADAAKQTIDDLQLPFELIAAQMRFFGTSEYVHHVKRFAKKHGFLARVFTRYPQSTFTHFSQHPSIQTLLGEVGQDIDPNMMRELFGNHVRVSSLFLSCGRNWQPNEGWARQPGVADLGSIEGVLPMPHLIASISTVVYLAMLYRFK